MLSKKELRTQYKNLREQMNPEDVKKLSGQICRHLLESELFFRTQCIYAYYPLGNEVDICPVVEEAWKYGKQVAFPKVFGETMRFFEVKSFDRLSPGTFGVMEPEEKHPVDWKNPLVLTPGVAFDRNGNRMGYGKGYYDRYFGSRQGAVMLGIAYEAQIAEKIPVGEYDRTLDGLVTENGVLSLISC